MKKGFFSMDETHQIFSVEQGNFRLSISHYLKCRKREYFGLRNGVIWSPGNASVYQSS